MRVICKEEKRSRFGGRLAGYFFPLVVAAGIVAPVAAHAQHHDDHRRVVVVHHDRHDWHRRAYVAPRVYSPPPVVYSAPAYSAPPVLGFSFNFR